jgi:Clathrin adaptor complex small chain
MISVSRYASLFFVAGINSNDNELITLEVVHRYVEILDRYFGNVSTFIGTLKIIQVGTDN